MKKLAKRLTLGFVQDLTLSVAASVFAFLMLRWVTEPMSGFSMALLKWSGLAAFASAFGLLFSNFFRRDRTIITFKSVLHLLVAILVKEAVLLFCIVMGAVQVQIPAGAAVLMLSDIIFTLLLCQYIHISRGSRPKDIRQISAAKTVLIVGTDEAAVNMANSLNASGSFVVVGLASKDENMDGRIVGDYPVYYTENPDSIERLRWKLGGIDCIFFTRNTNTENSDANSNESNIDHLTRDIKTISNLDMRIKRAVDLSVSFILLLVFAPVIGICAILVKMSDGGPVFYRQERLGKGGRIFKLVKFRSMRTDAESMGVPALCSGENDPRLTPIGRFLRSHHLDELPQLWNVLVGDMAFVGWRPERAYFIDKIMEQDKRFKYLFQIRPGVTSFATLYNGYTDTLEKMITRLDQDIYYLRSRSIWFDMKILSLTFLSIVSGKKF